ncbi:MAG: Flp pilus assembly complex ATPase component TadA [Lachnospiraceae bacterium]|nr:Flp pilus assembly complex ATPase component TadA [Lachnospiraceae bacterium]
MIMTVDEILINARQAGASDIHLVADEIPMMRVRGLLEPMNLPRFATSQILDMLIQLLPQQLREQYDEAGYCVYTYEATDSQRYRVSAYRQQSMAALAIRIIAEGLPKADELPVKLLDAVRAGHGLVLLTGRPGSGRSTTLATLGQYLGNESRVHIMTLGYTVEHFIQCRGSVVSQRTLKQDVPHMVRAIEEAQRMDVDVLLLDGLEGREAIQEAIRAVAAGMLVIAVVSAGAPGNGMQRLLEQFALAERGDVERQMRRLSVLETYQEFVRVGDKWQMSYEC